MRHVADGCGDRLGRARLQRCPRATKSNDLCTSTWTLVGAGLGARIAATLSDFRRDGGGGGGHTAPRPATDEIRDPRPQRRCTVSPSNVEGADQGGLRAGRGVVKDAQNCCLDCGPLRRIFPLGAQSLLLAIACAGFRRALCGRIVRLRSSPRGSSGGRSLSLRCADGRSCAASDRRCHARS